MSKNDESNAYYKKRVRRAKQKYSGILAKATFQKDVLAFRKKYDIDASGIKDDETFKKWKIQFKGTLPQIAVHADIKNILKEHRITDNQEFTIFRYCVFNDSRLPFSMLGAVHIEMPDKNGDNLTMKLVLGPDTTLEDIKEIWSFVKEKQRTLASWRRAKAQPWKNLERDKYAYDLRQKGKTLKQIARLINDKYDTHFIYSDVLNLINRYKKKVDMN